KPFDPTKPTLGILGKLEEEKGCFDLVAALAALKGRCDFNFLALSTGHHGVIQSFLRALQDRKIADRTWLLPLLPNWQVPSFIRACTAVCSLERKFAIKTHRPRVPREVLACGVCLLCSREIADKQKFRDGDGFADGTNVVLIEDPADIANLSAR